MNIPTDKHPRILMAEIALRNLENSFKMKSGFRPSMNKQQIYETLKSLNSNIQKLKYSFLDEEALKKSEVTTDIATTANKLFNAVKESYHGRTEAGKLVKLTVHEAIILWGTRLLMRLPERFQEPSRPTIEAGIDMQVVGIRNIVPIPDSNLFVTRVYNGELDFSVATNLQTLKAGLRVGVAFLPPVEIGGIVSEAMFLGDKQYSEDVDYGTRIYNQAEFGEVRNIL
ncbi:MAG: hypothetical protein ACXAC7_03015, partial [Candidatus Hodarchaeales archaeon]